MLLVMWVLGRWESGKTKRQPKVLVGMEIKQLEGKSKMKKKKKY